jgi:hypothetical protein
MHRKIFSVGTPLVAALLAGCADNQGGRLSLALTSSRPLSAVASPAFAFGAGSPSVVTAGDTTIVALGNDTIIIRSVELVLREVELKRVEAAGCDSVTGNDDCEEFETGPVLVALPLGSTATATVVSVNAPAGLYDELEFQVHKPESSDDAAFIAAHPDFDGVAVRVTGTYSQAGSRSDFTFTSDLNADQEILLSPPLTVSDGVPTNVTLRLDIGSWFLNAGGSALVNPASANKGQPNESVVKDRIQASIDAFRDDDHDGHDDDNEHT